MPDLDEDTAAARMHAIGNLVPAGDLFFRVDAGRVLVTHALLRDLAGLGDQQSRRSALPVILTGKRMRHEPRHRAVAGQRRHHKAVGQGEGAKPEGLEQFGRLGHFCDSGKMAGEKQVGIFTVAARPPSYRNIAGGSAGDDAFECQLFQS